MATATVGEASEIPWKFVFQWKIKNFLSLSSKEDEFFNSPSFYFGGASWYLRIYPNGQTATPLADGQVIKTIGYVGLYLIRISLGSPLNMNFSFGLKTVDEKVDFKFKSTHVFPEGGRWGNSQFLMESDILARKSELLPFDELTVICKIKYPKSAEVRNDISLRQDLRKMMFDGRHHDIILNVGDREFRAHRDVLRARSRVFESMLDHDMKEKNNRSIDIEDCDPEAMEQFMSYIYSGRVDSLDQSSMLNLYYIADKYDVQGLKDTCRDFIQISLSLTNISRVIQLSTNHSDSCLLKKATEYFMANALDIMNTDEWQSFLKENFAVGNELQMKSIKKLKST